MADELLPPTAGGLLASVGASTIVPDDDEPVGVEGSGDGRNSGASSTVCVAIDEVRAS